MTWILGIDTSHVVAVGVARDGEPVARVIVDDTRAHAEALMPSVLEACAQAGIALADVDGFAVGMGPGPFTGLRVGIATARTLAHVGGKPLHAVCSLDVVARQTVPEPGVRGTSQPGRRAGEVGEPAFVVAADARRKELYWALYDADGNRIGEPQVSAPTELPDLPVAGAVPAEYRELLNLQGPDALDPAVLAASWNTLRPAGDEPYYLRPADATVPGKPKSALPRLRARR
ncbi:MAG: tRNA (adenosine(37)-N6)-threonylcarbamoyltransferase complex dimerization subunit type 1 TsaB [Propionibacteriaceae bacterium]|nr:tRNA (adenosine(37)-N6)-threonylcarbamoyltransferase complex dimerization subunit type 1 TsaB [Propionibacteriaceae bacterium]